MVEKVIKYILTDGENYVVNSNGNILAKTKPDAFIWNTKEAAENAKEYSTNKKVKAYFYVEEIETYVADVPGYIEMEMKTVLEFYDIVKDCAESFDSMVEQLSKIDKELSDIDHFIEFTELNARDGYKIYKKQHELRKMRRELKYNIKVASDINSQQIDPETLLKLVNYFKTRRYIPKVADFKDILK